MLYANVRRLCSVIKVWISFTQAQRPKRNSGIFIRWNKYRAQRARAIRAADRQPGRKGFQRDIQRRDMHYFCVQEGYNFIPERIGVHRMGRNDMQYDLMDHGIHRVDHPAEPSFV